MWRWYTAEDRRQAAAVVLLLGVTGVFLLALGPVVAGLLMLMFGQSAVPEGTLARGPAILTDLWQSPSDPASALEVPHLSPVTFWLVAIVIMIATLVGFIWFAKMAYRMIAPTGTGFAGHSDIARDLSLSACRSRARITRPDLDRKARRTAKPAQLAIPLHQAPVSRAQLWLPLENATGVIAPQQSGKTLMDLLHKVIDAPGGLITTSTKLDLFLLTARARERGGSDVHVVDLTGAANWSRKVRWNPVRGCTSGEAPSPGAAPRNDRRRQRRHGEPCVL